MFLLPCRLKHPDGSGQLLGGRSGRSGGYVSYKDTPIVVDGDDDDDESNSHGGGGSSTRHVHREYVLEGYVLSLRRLIGTALCRYAVPVLEQQRLLAVLDLDKTLLVSVRADQASPAQRAAAAATFTANHVELLLMLRPGLWAFLTQLATRFDFAFCTMGTREYALEIYRVLRALCPDGPWSACREVISSDYSRVHSHRAHGLKDLRMTCTFAQWPRWRNTCVIVDDTVEVWPAECHGSMHTIAEFVGPSSATPVHKVCVV